MTSSVIAYLGAVAILAAVGVVMVRARGRQNPFFGPGTSYAPDWNAGQLILASFLTLFAELAFIRWIAVEIRVFAYFKNLALLLCFLGFGLGCALAKHKPRWLPALLAFLAVVLVIQLPGRGSVLLENLSQDLGGAADVAIWAVGPAWNWTRFLTGATLAAGLFVLIVSVFVPLGQVVSAQMDVAPSKLRAYSWNLMGSLVGVLGFLLMSRLMLPPVAWLATVLAGFALLQANRRDLVLVASLIVPLALCMYRNPGPDTQVLWTPYQQIRFTRQRMKNGDLSGGMMLVNHTVYQRIVNLAPDFLARHPGLLKEAPADNPYNLAFRFAAPSPNVLIVGSGAGNDVAAALRNGSRTVDAVEIDPGILALGRREHPEHPYDSPIVRPHLDDARSFLKRTQSQYDLILFGLLDSHSQFSDYSNMRIDNFVYTEESFREAARHLTPEGILFLKFQVDRPWLAVRLAEMLQRTFGKPPLIFFAPSSYSVTATCFVISSGQRVETALATDETLAQLVRGNEIHLAQQAVPVTTDDWPYLYQQGRWIPRTYYSVAVVVALVALGMYWTTGSAGRHWPSLFFFGMGAGFLLLETQIISRLALFFGTVWQVNGIVICSLLLALLLANILVEHTERSIPRAWLFGALFLGLLLAYYFPFNRIPDPTVAGLVAVAVFSIPVVFAGVLFSTEFRQVESPSAALGANILGAVAGGLLENLSFLFGMRALLLIALAIYALTGVGLLARRKAPMLEGQRKLAGVNS
jgi:spermidine synthase